jgi:uncharacterized protein YdeI (YjbR/CyaY-like superfamily)
MDVRSDKLKFFRSAAAFRRWLEKNHERADELWIGFYKKDSGKGGITYAQALDEALCFGWIDGIRKSIDADAFTIRFTRRRKNSIWSNVNIRHIERLTAEGRMSAPGLAAYSLRTPERSGVYSFERETAHLEPAMKQRFMKNRQAWKFYEAQPPYYRRITAFWIVGAKKDETRERRLAQLIELSAQGKRLPQLTPAPRSAKKA